MLIVRAIFVALLGMFLTFGTTGQALAASHQAAGQEKPEKAAAPATGRHVGTVKAVDPATGALTVTEKEGNATVSVGQKTSIKKGKDSLKLADLKPGDEVTVVYVKQDGKDVAQSVTVKAQ